MFLTDIHVPQPVCPLLMPVLSVDDAAFPHAPCGRRYNSSRVRAAGLPAVPVKPGAGECAHIRLRINQHQCDVCAGLRLGYLHAPGRPDLRLHGDGLAR